MKKILVFALACLLSVGVTNAQKETKSDKSEVKEAQIVFDKTTHDFGTFSESDPVVSCTFTFTNEGSAPLVIHQAIA